MKFRIDFSKKSSLIGNISILITLYKYNNERMILFFFFFFFFWKKEMKFRILESKIQLIGNNIKQHY